MATATITRPHDVPRSGGNGRAIALAIAMHLLLGALLFFGIRWQSGPPEVVQAELWSAVPQVAAPTPRSVPPPPKVEAPTPAPKAVEPEPPPVKADIAERTTAMIEPPKKTEVPKAEAPKVEPRPQPPAPKVPPKPSQDVRTLMQQAAVETQKPPSEVSSLIAAAGREGKDQQTSGPRGNDSYINRLRVAIRSQMRYPGTSPGNPMVEMSVEQLPNGEVVGVTVKKPSGVPAFDDAVERAIRAASPLPRDEHGKVERTLNLDYNMYEKP